MNDCRQNGTTCALFLYLKSTQILLKSLRSQSLRAYKPLFDSRIDQRYQECPQGL